MRAAAVAARSLAAPAPAAAHAAAATAARRPVTTAAAAAAAAAVSASRGRAVLEEPGRVHDAHHRLPLHQQRSTAASAAAAATGAVAGERRRTAARDDLVAEFDLRRSPASAAAAAAAAAPGEKTAADDGRLSSSASSSASLSSSGARHQQQRRGGGGGGGGGGGQVRRSKRSSSSSSGSRGKFRGGRRGAGGGGGVGFSPSSEGDEFHESVEENLAAVGRVKRKVAMVVGYVGSGMHGLMAVNAPPMWPEERRQAAAAEMDALRERMGGGGVAGAISTVGETGHAALLQAEEGELPTVESYLRRALYLAGMIGSRNVGHLERKVAWTRGSRTDKGVHAAKGVITFKAMVPATEQDLEAATRSRRRRPSAAPPPVGTQSDEVELGLDLAADVNAFLPEDIRVLSIFRVTSGYRARQFCSSRQYSYLLPPEVLAETGWSLEQLNALLGKFVGMLQVHNLGSRRRREGIAARKAAAQASSSAAELEEEEEEEEEEGGEVAAAAAAAGDAAAAGASWHSTLPVPLTRAAASALGVERDGSDLPAPEDDDVFSDRLTRRRMAEVCRFVDEMRRDPGYRRRVTACVAEPLVDTPLVGGAAGVGDEGDEAVAERARKMDGWLCVSVTGDSFVMHQIRGMMGLVLAIMYGRLPADWFEMVLSGPFALKVPRAPSEYLFLRSATFRDPNAQVSRVSPSDARVDNLAQRFAAEHIIPHIVERHASNSFPAAQRDDDEDEEDGEDDGQAGAGFAAAAAGSEGADSPLHAFLQHLAQDARPSDAGTLCEHYRSVWLPFLDADKRERDERKRFWSDFEAAMRPHEERAARLRRDLSSRYASPGARHHIIAELKQTTETMERVRRHWLGGGKAARNAAAPQVSDDDY